MTQAESSETSEKDAPLRYDIRLLGRILGSGVQFHRDADEGARQELQSIMSRLPTERAIRIIRAFAHFSHLANLAEDQHHIRRTRAYVMANAPPRPGSMAYALGRARTAGVSRRQLEAFFADALC